MNQILNDDRWLNSDWDLHPEEVYPPLFYCASLPTLWPIRYLIENGANIDEVSDNGSRYESSFALQHAIMKRKTENAKFLLHRNANTNIQGGKFGNALQAAATMEDYEIVQLLLDKGADVNAQGGVFGNALQAAAAIGNLETFQLLLDNGADVNARGGEYGTALQGAAARNNAEIILLLLDKGVDINAQGGRFGNAVQAAVARQRYNIARLLHSRGAKADPPGPEWEEMLSRVSKIYRREDVVNRLKEFQADPSGFLARDLPSRKGR
jgi:ankyrin repeat protein